MRSEALPDLPTVGEFLDRWHCRDANKWRSCSLLSVVDRVHQGRQGAPGEGGIAIGGSPADFDSLIVESFR
jgi:hypothetical protein